MSKSAPPVSASLDAHQLAGILLTMIDEVRSTITGAVSQSLGETIGQQVQTLVNDQLRTIIAEEVRSAVREALSEAPLQQAAPMAAMSEVVRDANTGAPPEALQAMAQEAAYQMAQEMAEQLGPYMVKNVAHEVTAQLAPLLSGGDDAVKEAATEATKDGSGDYMDLIHLELIELLDRIHATKSEVASLRPSMGATDQITAATMELEAVIQATEQATSDILEAAEDLQTTVERLRSPELKMSEILGIAEHLEDSATNILMTCSFQDLTGQRITAAVNTLLYVEESLTRIVELWGITQGTADSNLMRNAPDDDRPDKDLLNGPQMDGAGVSQDDIDKLFG